MSPEVVVAEQGKANGRAKSSQRDARRFRVSLATALVASLIVHAAFAGLASGLRWGAASEVQLVPFEPSEIAWIQTERAPAEPEPAPEPEPARITPPAPRASLPTAPRPRSVAAAAVSARDIAVTERQAAADPREGVESVEPVAPPRPTRIDPRHVANLYAAQEANGFVLPAASGGSGSAAPDASSGPSGQGATSESVSASLRASAPAPRDVPVLKPRGNGSYLFVGNGFDATIAKDGSVVMRDKYGGVAPPLVPMQLPDGTWTVSLGGAMFDLTALLEHAFGNDPYRSERRWFLLETRELRDRLADKAAEQATLTTLRRIWTTVGLSFEKRKSRTFAMWDDCTEDERGRRGRMLIERFVRERCPQHAGCGFSAQELATLNAHRHSAAAFAPYDEPAP